MSLPFSRSAAASSARWARVKPGQQYAESRKNRVGGSPSSGPPEPLLERVLADAQLSRTPIFQIAGGKVVHSSLETDRLGFLIGAGVTPYHPAFGPPPAPAPAPAK